MKKTLISLFLVLFSSFAYGIDGIKYDKTDENGFRLVITDGYGLDIDLMGRGYSLYTGLSILTNQIDSATLRLNIIFEVTGEKDDVVAIKKGAKALIRTGDMAVLQLESNEDEEGVDPTGGILGIKRIEFSLNITEEDLIHLFSGILKIRFEVTAPGINSYYEYESNKPKNGEHFEKYFSSLVKALQTDNSDITKDF